MAASRRHDLALVDVHLARDTNGITVARELTGMGVPCLFVTSHPEEAQASGYGLGCLIKPFSQEELTRSVELALEIAAGRQAALTPAPTPPRNLLLFG
jgi:DNA-binding response OmpR family regulator